MRRVFARLQTCHKNPHTTRTHTHTVKTCGIFVLKIPYENYLCLKLFLHSKSFA